MIRLNTRDKMTEELGKSLIGRHMHFTWHNREDNTIETMPGKVLDCKDNKIIVDTMDIFMLDDNTSKENNKMIKTFNIDDITDIFPFEEDQYGGFRVILNVKVDTIREKFQIDIATGDPITPKPIVYKYRPILGNSYVNVWSY